MELKYDSSEGRMTSKQSLFICWHLWAWLAEDDKAVKADWGGWTENGGEVDLCENDCPCCEYTEMPEIVEYGCDNCPMRDAWLPNEESGTCLSQEALFTRWEKAVGDDRKKLAAKIALAARQRYEKLCGEVT